VSGLGLWLAILAAAVLVGALKLAGHLIPHRLLDDARVARTAGLVTVALLSALVAVQTATTGRTLVLDARAPALAVAALALVLRAPFIVVIVLAALTAAALRLAGWG
jgi:hypothetical protein